MGVLISFPPFGTLLGWRIMGWYVDRPGDFWDVWDTAHWDPRNAEFTGLFSILPEGIEHARHHVLKSGVCPFPYRHPLVCDIFYDCEKGLS